MPVSTLLRLDRLFIGAASTAELLERALKFLVSEAGIEGAWFGCPQPDGNFRYDAMMGVAMPEYLSCVEISINEDPSGMGAAGRAWRTGQLAIVDDFLNDPWVAALSSAKARQAISLAGWRSAAAIPIRDGMSFILALYSRRPGFFSQPNTRPVVEHLVCTMGLALERQSLIVESKKRHTALQRLNSIYRALVEEEKIHLEAADEAALMNGTCLQLVETGLFDLVGLGWPDADDAIRYHYAYGDKAEIFLKRFCSPIGGVGRRTLSREVLRTGEVLFSNDYLHDPRTTGFHDAARELGINAWAAFPIHRGGALWGVMSVTTRQGDAFDPDTLTLLTSSAQLLGRALDAFDMRARLEKLNSLYKSLMTQGEIVLRAATEQDLFTETCRQLSEGGLFDAAVILPSQLENGACAPLAMAVQHDARHAEVSASIHAILRYAHENQQDRIFTLGHLGEINVPGLAAAQWEKTGWQSVASVGIARNNQSFARLILISCHPELFDGEVHSLLKRIADLLERALEQMDIKRQLDRELTHQAWLAMHDPLTGLYNRAGLNVHLEKAVARSQRSRTLLSVIMMDIDDFKHINDTHGHNAGDQMLKAFAGNLTASLRQTDFVARLGGDEFVLVLEDFTRGEDQIAVLERLSRIGNQPCRLADGVEIPICGSMGVTGLPGDEASPDVLLRHADEALYLAKRSKTSRKTCWRIYEAATTAV